MSAVRADMDATAKKHSSAAASMGHASGMALAAVGVGAAAVAAVSIKMAADFQTSMTSLVTGAGESEKNIKMVSQGILDMAPKVGATTQQLASGMYMIESAGYHGASGLTVLKAAAEGAKVGSADLGTVADAVTTALTDYHLKAADAATVTSQLVATVAAGKTHMQDLAGAMATVLPAASAAGLGLSQVLGAMATMTAKGTPAADAATYLKQTIIALEKPSAKAALEMSNLGLSSIDVGKNLGERGLTGTFKLFTDAIQAHMGPAGTVLIDKLKAAAGSTTKFQQVLANLPPTQQTYVAALGDMVGGAKSMQAALELTGASASTFVGNVKAIGATTAAAGGNVQGWANVQKDANQQLAEAKARMQVLGIELGQKLIPIFEKVIAVVMGVVNWLTKHQQVAKVLAGVIGVILVAATVLWVASLGPVLLIIAAVVIAVGGMVVAGLWLAKNWSKVFADIKHWFDDALQFLRSGFGTLGLLILGPLAPLAFVALHWQQIWAGMKVGVRDFVGFFTAIPGQISSVASTMWNGIVDAFRAAINTVISIWDGLAGLTEFTLPKIHIPGTPFSAGGEHIGPLLPQIPYMDMGGLMTKSGLIYAHAGEAITPASSGGGRSVGGGATVNVYVNGPVLNWDETAQALADPLRRVLAQRTSGNAVTVFRS